jgi:hypothetical protein
MHRRKCRLNYCYDASPQNSINTSPVILNVGQIKQQEKKMKITKLKNPEFKSMTGINFAQLVHMQCVMDNPLRTIPAGSYIQYAGHEDGRYVSVRVADKFGILNDEALLIDRDATIII